jgi:hypothetical protein
MTSRQEILQLRAMELKHGRVAMLAVSWTCRRVHVGSLRIVARENLIETMDILYYIWLVVWNSFYFP